MAGTPLFEIPDTTSEVLESLRSRQAVEDRAASEKLQLAVAWATMHSADSIVGPMSEWSEHALPLGGPGCPEVAEFCIPELAAVLSMSPYAGRAYLTDAVELAYRLPHTYARVKGGTLAVWRARRVAQNTVCLSKTAAGFVDQHVAPVAHTISVPALDRLIEEAMIRLDPDAAEEKRLAAAEGRCFNVHFRSTDHTGTVEVTATLDYADALDLDTAITHGAADQAALGSREPLDVRRSIAAGDLARHQTTLDLNPTTPLVEERGTSVSKPPRNPRKARQVVLHVHLSAAGVTSDVGALARVEEMGSAGGFLSVAQVAAWCANPDTQVTIKPVIDLNNHLHATSYEIPDRIREQVILRDKTCVFPGCIKNARCCDLDHRVPWDCGGETTTYNLAPLCRLHHRLKTTGGWTYDTPEPGVYVWTSPHGHRYRRDAHGTHHLRPRPKPRRPKRSRQQRRRRP